MRFGKIVQMVRKERGLTQVELAARLGVTSAYLSEVERGLKFPPVARTVELGKILNVNLDKFIIERLNDQMPEGFVVVKAVKIIQHGDESGQTMAS